MKEYPTITTVWKRDPANNNRTLIKQAWAKPVFEYLCSNEWRMTEKVDGTNIRVMINDSGMEYGGRTEDAQIPTHLFRALQREFMPLEDRLHAMFPDASACLYGEGYGAKIQTGGKYRQDQGFVLFDVKVGAWWLERHNVVDVAGKLGLEVVPEVGQGNLFDMISIAEHGFKSKWGDFPAEGIVAKPMVEICDRNGERIITKVKAKDFAA